jgi:hypothetical protein
MINASAATLSSGGPYNVFSEKFDIPIGTPVDTQYCEFISWQPSDPANDTGTGVKACTKVVGPSTNCPGFPSFASVPINLPDNSLSLAASAPSGSSSTPNATQVQIVPEGKFEITALNDISVGGNSVLPNVTPAVNAEVPDTTSVTLDYTPYVQTYPYDINQPSVTYENFYDQTIWTSSSTTTYTCKGSDSGGGSSSSCTHSIPAPFNPGDNGYYCPVNSPVYTYDKKTHTCSYTYTGSSNGYAWSSGSTTEQTTPSTVDGTSMPACYNRTFSLNGTDNPTNSATIDNPEDPTLLTVTGIVQADFDVTTPSQGIGFRQPTQVDGINTAIQVQVYHQNSDLSISGPQSYYNETSPNLYPNYASSSLNYQSSQDYSIPWSMSVALPPLQYGDEICINLTTNSSVGEVSPTSWTPQNVTQNFSNQQDASNPWPPSPQSVCTVYLAATPYLKVYGGDVSAGTASDINNLHQCTDSSAGIDTFNQGGSPYAGSGTQLAAFAVNVITGFASAQNDNGSGTSPPIGLTFSNTSGGYGGSFGASPSDCSADYYNQGLTSASTQYTDAGDILTSNFFDNNPAGIYAFNVNGGTINTTNIPVGYNITLYSSGPITIAGNITYGGVSTTLSQMPNLEIVTNSTASNPAGINIDNNVTQLTGIYVAEGTGGIINDCADVTSTNNWYPSTDGSPSCGQQLIVEGSFTANALYLSRTTNSIHEATPTEVPCAFGATPCDNAAEEFDYSPADWLTYSNQNTTPVVQSISSLPPIL